MTLLFPALVYEYISVKLRLPSKLKVRLGLLILCATVVVFGTGESTFPDSLSVVCSLFSFCDLQHFVSGTML